MSSVNIVKYEPDKRDIRTLYTWMLNQTLAVGSKVHDELRNMCVSKGEEFNPKPYMEAQRKYCWDKYKASNLMQTILIADNAVTEMRFYRNDDQTTFKKVVDGQQRLTSIFLFLINKLKLDMSKTLCKTFHIEGVEYSSEDLHNKYFFELPTLWQNIFWDRNLRFVLTSNCSDDQAEKDYMQINTSTKSLRPIEISKAAMGTKTRKFLRQVRQTDWLLHAMSLTSVNGNYCDEVLGQVITLLDNKDNNNSTMYNPVALTSLNINDMFYKYRNDGLPEKVQSDLLKIGLYLNDVSRIWVNYQRAKDDEIQKGNKRTNYNTYIFDFLDKVNTVMVMIAADIAIKHNINESDFANWAMNFFSKTMPNVEYLNACGVDNSKRKACNKDAVEDRLRLILASMASLHSNKIDEGLATETITVTDNTFIDENDSYNAYPNTDYLYANQEIKSLLGEIKDPFENDDLEMDEAS